MNIDARRLATGSPSARRWPLPLAVAIVALLGMVLTLDSSGTVPQLGEGPGLTLDETFNVQMGVYHVRAFQEYGLALLHPDSLREVFGNPLYNPDHPPLGRLVIGLVHEPALALLNPQVPANAVCVTCGRIASAIVFALTIWLMGWITSRWHSRTAGLIAALSMLLMPRLFAHAHLASLETFVNLTYGSTVLWVAARWNGERPPRWRDSVIGGILFGLCLLTKMQGVLLPVPIVLWALWRWRRSAMLPLAVFGATGIVAFFVLWPWLWLDPIEHLSEYFGRATDRQTLYCWYLNQKWADVDVPWHYPTVMFLVTVPIGLHLFGAVGVISSHARRETANAIFADALPASRTPSFGFLAANVLWPLTFFALPGITVYDGTRLFLMVFPLWSIFIGIGGATLLKFFTERLARRPALLVLALLMASQSVGLIRLHPLGLSYYNLLTGGLGGAFRMGFEPTYWGDSFTRSFLLKAAEQLPEGSIVDVAPVLHPFQLEDLSAQAPSLRERNVTLRAYDDSQGERIRHVLVFRRRADSWASLIPAPKGRLLAEEVRDGVQLAALYELSAP
jgi:hypothetical protein